MTKNILFSNSARTDCWGGVEKWTLTAARALIEKGYNAYLICRKNSIIEKKAISMEIPTITASFTNSIDWRTVKEIQRVIKQYNINLILCSTNLDVKLAGLAGKLTKIPVVSRQGLALISDKFKYKILIKYFTNSVLTNTYSIKKEYESYKWFPKNHIKVIYNGVEVNYTQISENKINELCSRHQLKPEEKIILSVGRLNRQKGFTYLIKAAQQAQQAGKRWRFLILGNGDLQQKLEAQIYDCQLSNIELLGFIENVRPYYALADVFVLSSLSEGTPNVVLEAMANKLPVIATDVNGVREVIRNGENGVMIPAKDPSAIYNAIDQLIDDTQLQEKFILNGYNNIIENFTIQKFSENFTGYINEVLNNYAKDRHQNA